jgi:hypothetical protein
MFNGQALQDKFVLNVLKFKQDGFFVEIGSNEPIKINNSYLLEHDYGWKGIMVEYDAKYLPAYQAHRPNSIHIIQDATTINYADLFLKNKVPSAVDYLQIDLEVSNGSTLRTLQKLDAEVMDRHTFATVTFEHDIYHTNYLNTRLESRAIFERRGYVRVFDDIDNTGGFPYEDWYVHPSLVDMNYIAQLQEKNSSKYQPNKTVGRSLRWDFIEF